MQTGYRRLTFSPKANTASPAAFTFFAALISRSWFVPHSGHCHSRVLSFNIFSVNPQHEQRLELGKKVSILTTLRPAQSPLYSSWRTNSPQLASAIALLSFGLRIMFFTFKVSTQTTWLSLISLRDNLCKLSNQQSEILA